MILSKTMELIGRGDSCFLFLAITETGNLSLITSKTVAPEKKVKAKAGDLFDFWILRNRQSLIVMDTQKDFRFDLNKTVEIEEVRSVIASPLVNEGKVIGTLRLNSPTPGGFFTDDLRLLDAISTLASSAISNSMLYQKTEELAIRDSLTGLYVRRYFLERLAEEHRRSLLTNTPLSFLMCDLDHFKNCNDRYGHGVGDFILIKVSEVLTKVAKHGIVSRYGGEEFAIMLPKTNPQDARILAENLRQAIAKLSLNVRRENIPVTISIGAATLPEDTLDSEELIKTADQRLYKAKKAGRNRIC
jgi:diguanylate cyclase (GGDEF)-like protein